MSKQWFVAILLKKKISYNQLLRGGYNIYSVWIVAHDIFASSMARLWSLYVLSSMASVPQAFFINFPSKTNNGYIISIGSRISMIFTRTIMMRTR